MKLIRRCKLGSLIMLCVFACILLVSVGQLIIISWQMKQLRETYTDGLNEQIVQASAENIGNWFGERVNELLFLAMDPAFATGDIEAIRALIIDVNTRYNAMYGAGIQTYVFSALNGWSILDDGTERDMSDSAYFLTAVESEARYSVQMPFLSRAPGDRMIAVISYAVEDGQGERTGYLANAILVPWLSAMLSQINIYEGRVFIADATGKPIIQDAREGFIPDFEGKEIAGIYEIADSTGASFVLLFSEIPYTQGWRLCVCVENSAYNVILNSTRSTMIVTWIILLICSMAVIALCTRTLTRPLGTLAAFMDSYTVQDPVEFEYQDSMTADVHALYESFRRMRGHIRTLIARINQESEMKRKEESRALQAQINPHFLYNTLDTIAYKAIECKAYPVADMTKALSDLFRTGLSGGQDFIALDDELNYVYSYLFIQERRFPHRLRYSFEAEPEILSYKVLKLIVQPLVENAIQHGILPTGVAGSIAIRAFTDGEGIAICVEDDGAGMDAATLEAVQDAMRGDGQHESYGLYNVHKRLSLFYGVAATLTLTSKVGEGTRALLRLPRREDI